MIKELIKDFCGLKDYSDLETSDVVYGNYYFEYALQLHRYDGVVWSTETFVITMDYNMT